jgi:hypothetical protein
MEDPIRILDHRTRQLRRRIVDQVKVQWDNCSPHSTIWEDAYEMHQQFSYLFDRLDMYIYVKYIYLLALLHCKNFGTKFKTRGVVCNIPF